MTKIMDSSAVPVAGKTAKKITVETVELKNVMFGDGQKKDVSVDVVPFDPYNDDHVEFAYGYSDMLFRAPSAFKNISEAARGYVALFMVHTREQETQADSTYNMVLKDTRACRTLFNREGIMLALNDFFENA